MTASLSCVIEVEGVDRGKGGHGRPRVTLKRPVREFLRGSDHYYRAVKEHLKGCDKCDPAEALVGFLDHRKEKMNGLVSDGLVSMAMHYERLFPGRIPDELVREYVKRSLDSGLVHFLRRIRRLRDSEIPEAVLFLEADWRAEVKWTLEKLEKAMRKDRVEPDVYRTVTELHPAMKVLAALERMTADEEMLLREAGHKGALLVSHLRRYSETWPARHGGPEWRRLADLVDVLSVMQS